VRLALPSRVPVLPAIAFGLLVVGAQIVEHTALGFSALFLAFYVLSVFAFNYAEGFKRAIGAYIFWFSMLIVIVGVTWKAVIGEPADSNLQSPTLGMTAYVGCMLMLMMVTAINKRIDFRPDAVGSEKRTGKMDYTTAGIGCIAFSMVIDGLIQIFGQAPGSILSALRQVDVFLVLGILLSTIGAIKDSDGRKSFNVVNLIGMSILFYGGLSGFSKQGMMTPAMCWIIAATYMRLKVRPRYVIGFGIVMVLNFTLLTPLSQSRDLIPVGSSSSNTALLAIRLMLNYKVLRAHAKGVAGEVPPAHDYFSTPQNGLIDRLTMMGVDDSLITFSDNAVPLGIQPVIDDYHNIIPHFLDPHKPEVLNGNYYAHEVGGYLAADDFSTGISFSPVAEAFRLGRWWGIFGILPAMWLIMFLTIDLVCGDFTRSPWGLLVIVYFAHAGPESLVSGLAYYTGFGNAGLIFAILFCTRLAPVIGTLLGGVTNPQESTANPAGFPLQAGSAA
jgi:hypothetical protein